MRLRPFPQRNGYTLLVLVLMVRAIEKMPSGRLRKVNRLKLALIDSLKNFQRSDAVISTRRWRPTVGEITSKTVDLIAKMGRRWFA